MGGLGRKEEVLGVREGEGLGVLVKRFMGCGFRVWGLGLQVTAAS